MRKKNWLMLIVLLVLAGVYLFYFPDWFKPKIIHITSTSRAALWRAGNRNATGPVTVPVTFSLTPQCKLAEITVVSLAAWQTNQNTLPLWHLVADTNAAPIKMFNYGQRLRGLKPQVPGTHAEPLQPDVTYRLFVTAGSAKGQHDLTAKAAD